MRRATLQPRLMDDDGDDGGRYAQVIVDQPGRSVDQAFTYSIPAHLEDAIQVGSYVQVPFGRRRVPGFVIGITTDRPDFRLKDVDSLLLDDRLFDESSIELARWLAEHYMATFRDGLRCMLPPGAGRGTETLVGLTDAGRVTGPAGLSRAPRQAVALRALADLGETVTIERLAATIAQSDPTARPASVRSAVNALADRGLVQVRRSLKRAQVRTLARQVARLCVSEDECREAVTEVQRRAPRQAETLQALLDSVPEALPVADLNRAAVKALADKGLIAVSTEDQERRPEAMGIGGESEEFLALTGDQRCAYERVVDALDARAYRSLLLHGVTGSGKTEVYLHAISAALERGRGAIVLVPEIALTPQMVGRFRARFGDRLALLHSALGQGERYDEWHRILRGEADLVVGARSAVFAPLPDIGVIVIDEEHERAYKQDNPPRYHAIEVARLRARQHNAALVLGGATPSLETYYASQTEEDFELCRLPERIDNRPLPEVEVVNLRGETLMGKGAVFSQRLLDALGECIERGEQAMLFLNRRGFSTFVMCRECGEALRCQDCAVSLIYHHQTRDMRCHHCDFTVPMPEVCPQCGSEDIGFHGQGTERVADQVEREFPGAHVLRMDRDTVSRKGAYTDILRRFARGEANVLIGTQMIAKGHDFPDVTLVGVLNADVGLHRPDFRATEHTFGLLTQVAGRAGRADKIGTVLVQTYNPDHPAIVYASKHDYESFYRYELEKRRENLYPPFTRLISLTVADEEEARTRQLAEKLAAELAGLGIGEKTGDRQYVGPAPAPLSRLRGRYRYHLLVKGPVIEGLREAVGRAIEALGDHASAVTVDVDPLDMM